MAIPAIASSPPMSNAWRRRQARYLIAGSIRVTRSRDSSAGLDALIAAIERARRMTDPHDDSRGHALAVSMGTLISAAMLLVTSASNLAAQGLPVENGSKIPVALWLVGAIILGLVMAWGILHNRKRTPSERQLTEQATKENYRQEDANESDLGWTESWNWRSAKTAPAIAVWVIFITNEQGANQKDRTPVKRNVVQW
jgi:hypothetical protein